MNTSPTNTAGTTPTSACSGAAAWTAARCCFACGETRKRLVISAVKHGRETELTVGFGCTTKLSTQPHLPRHGLQSLAHPLWLVPSLHYVTGTTDWQCRAAEVRHVAAGVGMAQQLFHQKLCIAVSVPHLKALTNTMCSGSLLWSPFAPLPLGRLLGATAAALPSVLPPRASVGAPSAGADGEAAACISMTE